MDETLKEYIINGLVKAGKSALLAGGVVFFTEVGEYLQVVPDTVSPESKAIIAFTSGILLYVAGFLKTKIKG